MKLRVFAFICGYILLAGLGLAATATACELPPLQDPGASRTVYRLVEDKGFVGFDAKAFMHEFTGKTSKVHGMIRLADPDRLTGAEACIRVDAGSLDTGNGTRDDIMRKDHLETASYPTIEFLLKTVEGVKRDSDGWEFGAGGSLSLHGVMREILLPVRVRPAEGGAGSGADGGVRLTGEIPLRMSDYRITIPKFLFFAVQDQVVVKFDVTARRTQ
ncbi:MAG: YceI family protein [Candidatus Methylomirabilota bacterium]